MNEDYNSEEQSPVVVAEGRLTIFPSFDRIPRTSLSGVRRSTIDLGRKKGSGHGIIAYREEAII